MDSVIRLRRRKLTLLGTLALGSLAGACIMKPVPQNPAYHRLADSRTILGVPNLLNVASNLPFLVAGIFGLCNAFRKPDAHFAAPWARLPWIALTGALFLTGLGSAYYHWAPEDGRLFWDRLPMAIGFGALLGVTMTERIGLDVGRRLWIPLLLAGPASLVFWRMGGDLRFYGLFQGWAIVLVPLMLALFPAATTGTSHWIWALALYALAKVFESADAPIYAQTGFVSGHTLKHLCAGAALGFIAWHLHVRRNLDEAA